MITPRFKLDQDNEFIYINIHAPYSSLQDFDVDVNENCFIFYCKPYFLRLNFPGEIQETVNSSVNFISDTQDFNFKINKVNKNEHFEDLSLITMLMEPKLKGPSTRLKIEVMDSNLNENLSKLNLKETNDNNVDGTIKKNQNPSIPQENDNEINQVDENIGNLNKINFTTLTKQLNNIHIIEKDKDTVTDSGYSGDISSDDHHVDKNNNDSDDEDIDDDNYRNSEFIDSGDEKLIIQNVTRFKMNKWFNGDQLGLVTFGYGFANQVYEYLDTTYYEISHLFDDIKCMKMSHKERKLNRVAYENNKFDPESYLFDWFNYFETVAPILSIKPPWYNQKPDEIFLSDKELDILKEFPKREYLLSKDDENLVNMGMLDILYAYFLEKALFNYEETCESAWGINRISSTLSWLDSFDNVPEMLIASYRRSLIFPLVRNLLICQMIQNHLLRCLRMSNKIFILKCFLDIYQMFNKGSNTEPRFILNELYIKDYCVYIQTISKETLNNLADQIQNIKIESRELNLNLREIERAALEDVFEDSDDKSSSSENSQINKHIKGDNNACNYNDDFSNVENPSQVLENLDYIVPSDEENASDIDSDDSESLDQEETNSENSQDTEDNNDDDGADNESDTTTTYSDTESELDSNTDEQPSRSEE